MRRLFLTVSILMMAEPTFGADWSEWELENSVAREQDWLVIRQPGEALFGGCKLAYSTEIERHFGLHSSEVIGEGFELAHVARTSKEEPLRV